MAAGLSSMLILKGMLYSYPLKLLNFNHEPLILTKSPCPTIAGFVPTGIGIALLGQLSSTPYHNSCSASMTTGLFSVTVFQPEEVMLADCSKTSVPSEYPPFWYFPPR